jgi:signal transduction histidine kinase
MVVQGGTQLLKLAEDVLDISSVDSGTIDVRGEPVNVQAQLAAALVLAEPERERMAVRIENRLPPAPIWVLGDARRLVQVFCNLLSNGCKYNVKGGTLRVESLVQADGVHISFIDQGSGLTREQIAELFQPFKRLPSHAAIAGTGMGLVVVRMMLGHMGGRVDVASEPGRGSRFTVRLRHAPQVMTSTKAIAH